jgi:hypothetical protein
MLTMRQIESRNGTKANVVLWVIQGLLAALFLFAGGMKLVVPLEMLKGPVPLPGGLLRFIGVAEVLGAVGLILPALLRVRPGLTPVAAGGLVIIMTGAVTITLLGGGGAGALVPLAVGLLSAFVAYGRLRLAPRVARSPSRPLRPTVLARSA